MLPDSVAEAAVVIGDGQITAVATRPPPSRADLEAGEGGDGGSGRSGLSARVYRITFEVVSHQGAFCPELSATFRVTTDEHFHLPLLLSPCGYHHLSRFVRVKPASWPGLE